MKIKFLFVAAILVCVTFFSLYKAKQTQKRNLPPMEPIIKSRIGSVAAHEEIIEDKEDKEDKAYSIGFERGKDAFLAQFGYQTSSPSIKEEYTVLFESNLDEEEQKRYKDISLKGYVDGYHRAGEMLQCPRSE